MAILSGMRKQGAAACNVGVAGQKIWFDRMTFIMLNKKEAKKYASFLYQKYT